MASVSSYLDGRPAAHLRLDANDQGVVLHEGVIHLFYDGAKINVGWLIGLA